MIAIRTKDDALRVLDQIEKHKRDLVLALGQLRSVTAADVPEAFEEAHQLWVQAANFPVRDLRTALLGPFVARERAARQRKLAREREAVERDCPRCQAQRDGREAPGGPPHHGGCTHGPHCTRDGCF